MFQYLKDLGLAQRFSFQQDNPGKAALDKFKTKNLNVLQWPRWTFIQICGKTS